MKKMIVMFVVSVLILWGCYAMIAKTVVDHSAEIGKGIGSFAGEVKTGFDETVKK